MMTSLRTSEANQSGSRIDIQALRAVAVLLVVAFHFFPSDLKGGYIGVDAFLATSGFLITRHLARELDQQGSIALVAFWARRARRLLPASFLVLIAIAIAAFFFTPPTTWPSTTRDLVAATLYSVNFLFAHDSTDYFAHEAAPSPVQHYWSLCVEEQFYLFWPLVFASVALLAKRKPEVRQRLLAGVCVLLFALSFALSVKVTDDSPAEAYFLPWTRAWEFIAGGLLAIFNVHWPTRVRAEPLRWLGFASLLLIAIVWQDAVGFPGYIAALPVAATLLVLVPKKTHERPVDYPVLRALEPLGDISYGVYLWHWPLLVLAQRRLDRELTTIELLAIFALTITLAIVSKRYVEDPIRFAPRLTRGRPRRTLLVAAVGTCAVLVFPGSLDLRYESLKAAQVAEIERAAPFRQHPCFGAGSPTSGPPCMGLEGQGFLIPSTLDPDDRSGEWKCMTGRGSAKFVVCEFGAEGPKPTFALVGDSHAAHLLPGIAEAARRSNARFIAMLKGGCPLTRFSHGDGDVAGESCEIWKSKVRQTLAERRDIHTVISVARVFRGAGRERTAGFVEEWQSLPSHIRQVIAIRDVPKPRPSLIECLDGLPDREAQLQRGACARPRAQALRADPAVRAAKQLRKRARAIDLSPIFCDEQACFPVMGNSLVYFDDHHLTEAFSATLWPHFMQIFDPSRRSETRSKSG